MAKLLAERKWCEFPGCRAPAVDCHEIKTRARGGSILDPLNIAVVCRSHHNLIGDNQALAVSLGLLRHSWDPPVVAPEANPE